MPPINKLIGKHCKIVHTTPPKKHPHYTTGTIIDINQGTLILRTEKDTQHITIQTIIAIRPTQSYPLS